VPFSLHENALYALLAVAESDLRRLMSVIARIEADPIRHAHDVDRDSSGEAVNICFDGPFRIHYVIERNGAVFIRDILAR
jgi:hypothetical protein